MSAFPLNFSPVFSLQVHLRKWVVLAPARCKYDALSFVSVLKDEGRKLGIQVLDPSVGLLASDRTCVDYATAVRRNVVAVSYTTHSCSSFVPP